MIFGNSRQHQLLDDLQQAASIGDVDSITKMADELKAQQLSAAAETIIQLVEEFDFDGITEYVKQSIYNDSLKENTDGK